MSTINDFLGFNPHETEAAESFEGRQEPIPNGRYKAVATSAKRTPTKKADGWFWEFVFTIAEGQYEGKTVTHRFNMANASEEAVAIGRSQLRRYLDAIGNLEPQDENDLCGVAVFVEIECKKSTYTNRKGEKAEGINNEITKIDPYAHEPSKAETTATEPSKAPPWKR
ncbi:MAG: hypothetical protein LBI05_11390 [Planctomycetaceae bacterium]|jgi:hypothetical protein|nr:hypothetical protein [Planctomycetaceae bacterium]